MIAKTCFFIGNQSKNLLVNATEQEIYGRLSKAVKSALLDGYEIFMCGGCQGADFLFADAVVIERASNPDIKLQFVLACSDQSEEWSREDRDQYSRLLDSADGVVCLNEKYKNGCVQQRDRYMADRSTLLIAAYNGISDTAEYAYKYATKKHLRVVNILDRIIEESEQLSFL